MPLPIPDFQPEPSEPPKRVPSGLPPLSEEAPPRRERREAPRPRREAPSEGARPQARQRPSEALGGEELQRRPRPSGQEAPRRKPAPQGGEQAPARRRPPEGEAPQRSPRGPAEAPRPRRRPEAAPPKARPKRRPVDIPEGASVSDAPAFEALEEEWETDPRTGKHYRKMPATEWTSTKDGGRSGFMSVSHFSDDDMLSAFDGTSMNLAAESFLAHLRVPPDKKEQERLRREKAELKKAQDAAYQRSLQATSDEDATPED